MQIIIHLLATYALAFILKEKDGPFGIFNRLRNLLFNNKYLGVFFFKLFDCYLCLGTYCSSILYLEGYGSKDFHLNLIISYGLAGGAFCVIMDAILNKLTEE